MTRRGYANDLSELSHYGALQRCVVGLNVTVITAEDCDINADLVILCLQITWNGDFFDLDSLSCSASQCHTPQQLCGVSSDSYS